MLVIELVLKALKRSKSFSLIFVLNFCLAIASLSYLQFFKGSIDNSLDVKAKSLFKPELSNIDESNYCFEYEISIINKSKKQIKVLSRHWNIKDGLGRKKAINGEGVIGKKPIIDPGESYKYKSYCPLTTEFGSMDGFYTMKDEEGNLFKTSISLSASSILFANSF